MLWLLWGRETCNPGKYEARDESFEKMHICCHAVISELIAKVTGKTTYSYLRGKGRSDWKCVHVDLPRLSSDSFLFLLASFKLDNFVRDPTRVPENVHRHIAAVLPTLPL